MGDTYNVATPENVELDYEIAGIGSRFVAIAIDTVLQMVLGGAVVLVLVIFYGFGKEDFLKKLPGIWEGVLMGFLIFLSFLISFGYFIILEMVMNGQTLGKRILNIRVRKDLGNAPSFWDLLLRNLIRIVDMLPIFYGVGLVVMFMNKKAKRLGDYAAGTVVVKELPRKEIKKFFSRELSAPAAETSRTSYSSQNNWISSLIPLMNQQDYLLLENLYHRRKELSNLTLLAEEIIKKIYRRAGMVDLLVLEKNEVVGVLQEILKGYETFFS